MPVIHWPSERVTVTGGAGFLGGYVVDELRRRGVFANVVTFPAVRRKLCRLRLCVMNSLTREELDTVLRVMGEVGRAHGLI